FDLKIILGKVRPFLRRLTEAHPQVLIIALALAHHRDFGQSSEVCESPDVTDTLWPLSVISFCESLEIPLRHIRYMYTVWPN
ncbi:hypothetical protein, partial [Mycobacteroides abscessus]|uniref:hypothetical protein n=1 Tax=Mycobacteroides abscessus TaxID=36809 RepID=UPI000ABE3EC2